MILSSLIARGEALAAQQVQKKIQDVAASLRNLFGSSAVTVEAGQAIVAGRGVAKRWLSDPTVRFLRGTFQ